MSSEKLESNDAESGKDGVLKKMDKLKVDSQEGRRTMYDVLEGGVAKPSYGRSYEMKRFMEGFKNAGSTCGRLLSLWDHLNIEGEELWKLKSVVQDVAEANIDGSVDEDFWKKMITVYGYSTLVDPFLVQHINFKNLLTAFERVESVTGELDLSMFEGENPRFPDGVTLVMKPRPKGTGYIGPYDF